MIKKFIPILIFSIFCAMSFQQHENTLPIEKGSALVVFRTSYQNAVPREQILTEILRQTLGKTVSFNFIPYVDDSLIFFSPSANKIAQYNKSSNFDKYKTSVYAANYLIENTAYFQKLMGEKYTHIIIFESDSPFNKNTSKLKVNLCMVSADKNLEIKSVSYCEDSFTEKTLGDPQKEKYSKIIADAFIAETGKLGFFVKIKK
ncbi:MAG TPA: hypothetical protein PK624_13770 [Spirochaetota bacterium]|nr:hypothetical protein [Spirochaetota bacterium]HPK57680.1 hypothetical protein [Spirochaetota bacterium]